MNVVPVIIANSQPVEVGRRDVVVSLRLGQGPSDDRSGSSDYRRYMSSEQASEEQAPKEQATAGREDETPKAHVIVRRKSPITRSIIALAVIGLCALLSIQILNTPAPKNVRFTATCSWVVVPIALRILLPGLQQARLVGFSGDVNDTRELLVGQGKQARKVRCKRLTFRPIEAVNLPYVEIQPLPDPGDMVLDLAAPAVLQAATPRGVQAGLRVVCRHPVSDRIELHMDAANLGQITRYAVLCDDRQTPIQLAEPGSLQVRGDVGGLALKFCVLPKDPDGTAAELSFAEAPVALPFRNLRGIGTVRLTEGTVSFGMCSSFTCQIGRRRPDNLASDFSESVVVQPEELTLSRLTLQTGSSNTKPSLSLEAAGTVRSVMRSDDELLPTRLDDILNSKPDERGIAATIAVFILAIAGVVVKRALDVLAEWLLPKSEG